MLIPGHVLSDRIVLKDGTIEVSEHIWESEKYVHFILKGTKAVEVRYAKEIVARVEKESPETPDDTKPLKKEGDVEIKTAFTGIRVPGKVPPFRNPESENESITKPPLENSPPVKSRVASKIQIDRSMIAKNRNTSFYDPRRPKRYWAFHNSHHTTLKGALQAMAKLYGKPAEWVEANMGEENDLGIIHSRLMAAYDSDADQMNQSDEAPASAATVFHDARRPLAFQTNEKRFFRTRDEALADLSEQYGQPVAWISVHMGKTNLLRDIHENLAKAVKALSEKPMVVKGNTNWKPLNIPDDIHFYDPRRERRYWATPGHRFNTYQEATAALARQYGVPVKWIEAHMGDTNRLNEMHENIRNSLSGQ